jgi:hypothetical protein
MTHSLLRLERSSMSRRAPQREGYPRGVSLLAPARRAFVIFLSSVSIAADFGRESVRGFPMTKKIVVGDVFEVQLDHSSRRYFQYVADDASQLHSNVVRVFRGTFRFDEPLDICRVISGEIDFYIHVLLPIGLKLKAWRKCGNAPAPADHKVLFRDSSDYGNPKIKISRNWFVWKINGPHEDVGELTPKFQNAEIGIVVQPASVIHRMRTGKYDFLYPEY